MIGVVDSPLMASIRLVEPHTRASSSTMIAWVTWSAPGPAVLGGDAEAGQLHSTQALKLSQGYSPVASTSAALGAIFVFGECRASPGGRPSAPG